MNGSLLFQNTAARKAVAVNDSAFTAATHGATNGWHKGSSDTSDMYDYFHTNHKD
jgi:hypothetical protein